MSTLAVTLTGIAPATLTIELGTPGPQGPTGPTGPTGPAGPAGPNAAWGNITGTLSSQTDLQSALNLKANLASPALSGVPTAPTAATLTSTTQLATTAFVQQELMSGTANARNLEVYVRNQTGSTIPAGSIVYINGATGNRPTITLAQANNDANSAQTMGFTKTAIANNAFGFVVVRGEVENLNTSALTEGVQLYLSPTTAGTWTTTKPSAPQHLVYVGICVRAHPTLGVILVAVQNGYELPELHDVKITSPTNGQVLKYDSAQSLWVNGTDSAPVTSVAGRTGAVTLSNTDISGLGTMATATATDYLSKAGNLSGLASPSTARTNLGLGTISTFNDAPSDGSQYARKNGAWDVVTGGGGSAVWGGITGTLSSQTDLQNTLNGKASLSGATFTGAVNTPTVSQNNVQARVLNAISSEIFNGMSLADYVAMQLGNFATGLVPSDITDPVSESQYISYSICCPDGLNKLLDYCTSNGGSIVIVATNSNGNVTWTPTSFASSNSETTSAPMFYTETYDFYVYVNYEFPAGGTVISQRSRMKVYSQTL